MYYYGYNSGYSYGSPSCNGYANAYPVNYSNGNNGAIVLVLFILLVIIIGSRIVTNNN